MTTAAARLQEAPVRARVIASAAPFGSWPEQTVRRLAESSRVVSFAGGATVVSRGEALDALLLVVDGIVQASAAAAAGRRFIFKIDRPGRVYGLISLVDGLGMTNDVIAAEPTTAIRIPFDAIRAELALTPALWSDLALELATRSRGHINQLTWQVFDPPRSRLARLLVSLAVSSGESRGKAVLIGLRLTQDRLAEMLALSRQTTTALLREMTDAGLVEWRYGRATVLDMGRLRDIADAGIGGS